MLVKIGPRDSVRQHVCGVLLARDPHHLQGFLLREVLDPQGLDLKMSQPSCSKPLCNSACGAGITEALDRHLDHHFLQDVLDAEGFADSAYLSVELSLSAAQGYGLLRLRTEGQDVAAQLHNKS